MAPKDNDYDDYDYGSPISTPDMPNTPNIPQNPELHPNLSQDSHISDSRPQNSQDLPPKSTFAHELKISNVEPTQVKILHIGYTQYVIDPSGLSSSPAPERAETIDDLKAEKNKLVGNIDELNELIGHCIEMKDGLEKNRRKVEGRLIELLTAV